MLGFRRVLLCAAGWWLKYQGREAVTWNILAIFLRRRLFSYSILLNFSAICQKRFEKRGFCDDTDMSVWDGEAVTFVHVSLAGIIGPDMLHARRCRGIGVDRFGCLQHSRRNVSRSAPLPTIASASAQRISQV